MFAGHALLKSIHCAQKMQSRYFGAEKAPVGMLTWKTDSLDRKGAMLGLEDTKITICVLSTYRSLLFEENNNLAYPRTLYF